MKFSTKRLPLPVEQFGTNNAGEELWVDVPIVVKEGFAKRIREEGTDDKDGRKVNAEILRLVSAWNLDDDAGKVLPLVRDAKNKEAIDAILAEVPLPLFAHIATSVTRTELTENVLGNSRT